LGKFKFFRGGFVVSSNGRLMRLVALTFFQAALPK
jgi:hypothetical protein